MKVQPYIVIFLFLLQTSCFQEKEIFLPDYRKDDPAFLYQQDLVAKQQYSLQLGDNSITIKTLKNSYFKFPVGCLLRENGTIYSGDVVMEITQTNKLGDFILLGKIPVAQNAMLQAQRLLNIKFSANGEELHINPQVPVEWIIDLNEKEAFTNIYKEITSEDNDKTWVLLSTLSLQDWVVEEENEVIQGKGIVTPLIDNGWYLLAKPWIEPTENMTEVCTDIETGFTETNSVLYALQIDNNLIAPVDLVGEESNHCSGSYRFVENSGIKFVLISYREDGKYYFDEVNYIGNVAQKPTLKPKVLSLENITEILQHY